MSRMHSSRLLRGQFEVPNGGRIADHRHKGRYGAPDAHRHTVTTLVKRHPESPNTSRRSIRYLSPYIANPPEIQFISRRFYKCIERAEVRQGCLSSSSTKGLSIDGQ